MAEAPAAPGPSACLFGGTHGMQSTGLLASQVTLTRGWGAEGWGSLDGKSSEAVDINFAPFKEAEDLNNSLPGLPASLGRLVLPGK